MAKDPAFLFYSSDFLTGTMFFSDEQVGKYMRLLCAQHQNGSLTEEEMLKICGNRDDKIFNKFKQGKDGLFQNQRLTAEVNKRKKYSASRSKNIGKRWSKEGKPLSGKKIDDIHMKNTCNTHVIHMENENEIENRDIKVLKDKKKKHRYGEYKHVFLTDEEKQKLKNKFGTAGALEKVKNLDEAIEQHGYKYTSHYLTILKWHRKDLKKNKELDELNLDINGNELPAL